MPYYTYKCLQRVVALLTEGVDRNTKSFEEHGFVIGSPSSRRAWIEIGTMPTTTAQCRVALLTEGVDRNRQLNDWAQEDGLSPSSRRAWIEIRSVTLMVTV